MERQAIDIRKVKIQARVKALRAAGWGEVDDPFHEKINQLFAQWFPDEALVCPDCGKGIHQCERVSPP